MTSPVLRTLAAGDILFYEGDGGDSAYVVESGVIAIRHFKDEEYITLAELKEGALFGEIALIDKRPRSATAMATSDTVVREINKENFLEYLKSSPDVGFEIMQRLAGYARNASDVLLKARINACLEKVQKNRCGALQRLYGRRSGILTGGFN